MRIQCGHNEATYFAAVEAAEARLDAPETAAAVATVYCEPAKLVTVPKASVASVIASPPAEVMTVAATPPMARMWR